jgi:hypothetical protein
MQTYDTEFLKKPLEELQNSITAAVIGISKNRWKSVDLEYSENLEYAKQQMQQYQFDILPIGVTPLSYFRTNKDNWGDYSSIEKAEITESDKISANTDFLQLLEKFSTQKRNFFFLEKDNDTVGLVTLGNLNCREVKSYLFVLMCEFEIRLAEVINKHMGDADIEIYINSNKKARNYSKIIGRYKGEKRNHDILECFDISHLLGFVIDQNLYQNWNLSGAEFCSEIEIEELNLLRIAVAHPINVLISNHDSCIKLEKNIYRIQELLEIMRKTATTQ